MSLKPIARLFHLALTLAAVLGLQPAAAQQAPASPTDQVQEVIITGSRIAQTGAQAAQPLSIITSADIERTGLASVGELLQQLTTSGKALNAKFNSSGNFGYPPDGGGIGAGSAQVDLRNLDSKRVLVLVDGIRWVNESSASGVSGSADLNTIPLAIVDRIEVLEDGASAIYGSDAIAGVVNIITRKKFDGAEVHGYVGDYSKGGQTTEGPVSRSAVSGKFVRRIHRQLLQAGGDQLGQLVAVGVPEPRRRSCSRQLGHAAGTQYFLRSGRATAAVYGSCTADQANLYDITLNNGTTTPVWNPTNPVGRHLPQLRYGADRFNFAPYNLLLTPSKRKSIFASVTYDSPTTSACTPRGCTTTAQSTNQAAPEPIFVGPVRRHRRHRRHHHAFRQDNPYNPFGIDLDAARTSAGSPVVRSKSAHASSTRTSTPGTSTSASTAPCSLGDRASTGTSTTCTPRTRPTRCSSTATTSPR